MLAAGVDAFRFGELAYRGDARLLGEVHEDPLEQRGPAELAFGCGGRDDPADRQVGVGDEVGEVRREHGEEVGEGAVGADAPAGGDGVHDVADDPFQALG